MTTVHTRSDGAIMTVLATISSLTVIDRIRRQPVVTGMTGLTHIAGNGMRTGLKGGTTNTVMTTRLGTRLTRDRAVIEYGP